MDMKPPPEAVEAAQKAFEKAKARVDSQQIYITRVRIALLDAESNFHLQPQATYDGIPPRIMLYKGDAMPTVTLLPHRRQRQELLPYLRRLLKRHNADWLAFHGTHQSGVLNVIVLERDMMHHCRCAILPYRGEYNLAEKWQIETHVSE
jgi:hypothetical protein